MYLPLNVSQADGKLLRLSQVVKIRSMLLQFVQLVRTWQVLDERLQKVLRQHCGVTSQNALSQVWVTYMLQSSTKDN